RAERAGADHRHSLARPQLAPFDGVQRNANVVAEGAFIPRQLLGQRVQRSDVDRRVFRQAAGHGEADVCVALLGPAVVQTQLIQALQAARAPTAADVHLDTHAIAGTHFVDPLASLHVFAVELGAWDMLKVRARELSGKDLLIRTADAAGFDSH